MAGKARALLHKRCHVTTDDVCDVALPVMRHRIIPTFNAEAAGIDTDTIVAKLVQRHRAAAKREGNVPRSLQVSRSEGKGNTNLR